MTTGNLLIRRFTKRLALKKIGDFFNKPFAITKTKKPHIIGDILLINQKWLIADLETQTQSLDPEPEPRTRTQT